MGSGRPSKFATEEERVALNHAPKDGLAENLERVFTGKYVRLRQYLPGYYPRESLYILWKAAEEDGACLQIFYDKLSHPKPDTPIDTRGDLAEFVSYFNAPDKLLVIFEDLKTSDLVGFMWLSDMVPRFRATVNIFFRKRYRGRAGFEGARLFREYATRVLGFPTLWGLTPWTNSVAVGRWLGMKTVAVLPKFQLIDGVAHDVFVLRYEADDGR